MSRSTSRRRAAGIGAGALAAVVLVVPSALARTDQVVLEPAEGSVTGYISASPTTGEPDGEGVVIDEAVAVPASGIVSIALTTGLSAVDGEVVAGLVDQEEYEAFAIGDADEAPTPFLEDLDVTVVVEDGVTSVDVTVPVDDPALADVDEAYLVVEGVVVDLLATPSPVAVPLDLVPVGEADPAVVETGLGFLGGLDEELELQAGEDFAVELPDEGFLRDAGVPSLDGLFVLFASLEGVELEAELRGLAVEDLLSSAIGTTDPTTLADEDGEAFEDLPLVEADGSTATVTLSEDQPEGPYVAFFVNFSDDGADVVLSALAEVAAARPAPTPTPTETGAPVPAPTATATTPPRRNPGLRSNTGVETAAVPGSTDGQLVGAGAVLLVLGGGVTAAVVRRRPRA